MAEVLVQFDEPQRGPQGLGYVAQIWGRRLDDGLWEAWIEFAPSNGGEPIRTPRETEQLTRGDLRYWAAGLTRTYLQDAFQRALIYQASRADRPMAALPTFEPPHDSEHTVLETNSVARPAAVLDPFALYRHSGEYVLRQELRSLSAHQLRDIIVAYDIPDIDTIDVARTFEDALAEQVVAGVQQLVGDQRVQTLRLAPKTLA